MNPQEFPTQYEHAGMSLRLANTEQGPWAVSLDPGEHGESLPAAPLIGIGIAGVPHGVAPSATRGVTSIPAQMQASAARVEEDYLVFEYRHEALGLLGEVALRKAPGAAVFRAETTVRNVSDEPRTLTHLSSFHMPGIATGGLRPWDDPERIRVHYCRQTWEGEGQWQTGALAKLGLLRTSRHDARAAVHIASQGSFSTANYLPMVVVEDRETGQVWYAQVETSSPWHLEIGFRALGAGGALFLHADGADERFGGWARTLSPGESFTAPHAAVGCCTGGFNEALRELTAYRRNCLVPAPAWDGDCPVAFNDYMNCLWANPSIERLEPLIDAVSESGAEVFVIDAGWFGSRERHWGMGLGDWEPSEDRFGPKGLQGILDYIKDRGMIPGIWLEMEVCGEDARLSQKPDSWFLMRHGVRVGGGARQFLNFTNPDVRAYLHRVIDRLAEMGVGFIKNDYNECVGAGDDVIARVPADGLLENTRAFYAFIDEVRARHPRLILENCGSGAMRQDYGALSHFHVQSSSDQEWYYKYPSIIMGSAAAIAPEQLGIWAYPMALLFDNMANPEVLTSPEFQARQADGEETIFNLVSGLCGNLYLSGHLNVADEKNFALIREGVALYKQERAFIHQAFPFWPCPFVPFGQDNAWAGLGLMNAAQTRCLLAVWRLSSAEEHFTFSIDAWKGTQAKVRQCYPAQGYDTPHYYSPRQGTLTVQLDRPRTARYFLLER